MKQLDMFAPILAPPARAKMRWRWVGRELYHKPCFFSSGYRPLTTTSIAEENAYREKRRIEVAAQIETMKRELVVGSRRAGHSRFRCPVTRVEWVTDEIGTLVRPKWFKGPDKRHGEWAIHFPGQVSVYVQEDYSQPDPSLDEETMDAWRTISKEKLK
jgi:hypothetical protein